MLNCYALRLNRYLNRPNDVATYVGLFDVYFMNSTKNETSKSDDFKATGFDEANALDARQDLSQPRRYICVLC